jgi:benzylsuccinate CoA-transferase BbsF subunit
LSLAVDFARPEGAELIKRLVAVSDVVVENYSPGVLAKRGLDYPDLRAVREDIIMLAMSAAGQTGPLHRIRTYGPSISALSGLDSMVGYPGERVLGSQGFYPDMVGAIHGVIGVLAALWHRDRTGRGQYIDLSQWEATVGMLGDAILDYTMNGTVRGTQGNRNAGASPHGNYPCAGDDTWVAIAVSTEAAWEGFRRALGDPGWTREPWAADAYLRVANAATVDRHVAEWTRERSPEEVAEALQREGVPAGPSLHVGERYFHPHFSERGFHVDLEHPATGVDIVGGIPWKLDGTPGQIRRPAPLYGEHTDYVLGELLEIPEDERAGLRADGVIG